MYSGTVSPKITHSTSVCVALGIQHAMRMCHIVIRSLSASTIFFFRIISQTARLAEKKFTERKMWLLIFSTACAYHSKKNRRSQWPRGLRRRSAAARLLGSWVRIPPGTWTFVCCDCCVLSGRGLCDELITRPVSPTDCGASLCVI